MYFVQVSIKSVQQTNKVITVLAEFNNLTLTVKVMKGQVQIQFGVLRGLSPMCCFIQV